jgi:hypothetical protein
MPCVDKKGNVNPSLIEDVDISQMAEDGTVSRGTGHFFQWNPAKHNIADILVAIRSNMHLKDVCGASSSLGNKNY